MFFLSYLLVLQSSISVGYKELGAGLIEVGHFYRGFLINALT